VIVRALGEMEHDTITYLLLENTAETDNTLLCIQVSMGGGHNVQEIQTVLEGNFAKINTRNCLAVFS
jgi:hypothetical protein